MGPEEQALPTPRLFVLVRPGLLGFYEDEKAPRVNFFMAGVS